MNKKINNDTPDYSGFSLGLVFIVTGILIPFFFQNSPIPVWVATLFIGGGIAGIGIETEENTYRKGFSSIGIGAFFLLFSLLFLVTFTNTILKIIGFIILVIGLYAFFIGLFENLNIKKEHKKPLDKKSELSPSILKKISWNSIFAFTGFVVNILLILDRLGWIQ